MRLFEDRSQGFCLAPTCFIQILILIILILILICFNFIIIFNFYTSSDINYFGISSSSSVIVLILSSITHGQTSGFECGG